MAHPAYDVNRRGAVVLPDVIESPVSLAYLLLTLDAPHQNKMHSSRGCNM